MEGTGASTTDESKVNVDNLPFGNSSNLDSKSALNEDSDQLLDRPLSDLTTHRTNSQTLAETEKKDDPALSENNKLAGSDSTDTVTAGNATNECTKLTDTVDAPLEAVSEDPSIESYSMFELGSSIKTFAASGIGAASDCETKLSVPRSVNASLKLRTMSSFSVGEGSQKDLSWLEDEAKCLLEGDAECNIEPLGVHDKVSRFGDETMGETVNVPQNDRAHQPDSPIDVHTQTKTDGLQAEPDTTLAQTRSVTETVEIEFPRKNVHKQSPSVNQLKMALFLESTKVNRQLSFSNYWESLERHITLSSYASEKHRSRLEIDTALNIFLVTTKMKRLHNKLVLGETSILYFPA